MIRVIDCKLVLTHWNNLVPIVREQFHSLGKILHFQKCNSSTKREKSISKLSSNQRALCEVVIGNFNHVKKFTWGRFLSRCAQCCYVAPQHISIWFLAIHICLHDNFCPRAGCLICTILQKFLLCSNTNEAKCQKFVGMSNFVVYQSALSLKECGNTWTNVILSALLRGLVRIYLKSVFLKKVFVKINSSKMQKLSSRTAGMG